MNWNGRHAGAAFDTEMRAFLPDLEASLGREDPTQVFGFHLLLDYMKIETYMSRYLDSSDGTIPRGPQGASGLTHPPPQADRGAEASSQLRLSNLSVRHPAP